MRELLQTITVRPNLRITGQSMTQQLSVMKMRTSLFSSLLDDNKCGLGKLNPHISIIKL